MSEWINVKDQMPPSGEYVLCAGKKGGIFIGRRYLYMLEEDESVFMCTQSSNGRSAFYWMPLPEPPEETKQHD